MLGKWSLIDLSNDSNLTLTAHRIQFSMHTHKTDLRHPITLHLTAISVVLSPSVVFIFGDGRRRLNKHGHMNWTYMWYSKINLRLGCNGELKKGAMESTVPKYAKFGGSWYSLFRAAKLRTEHPLAGLPSASHCKYRVTWISKDLKNQLDDSFPSCCRLDVSIS
jgi:hypothetical protein